MNDKPKVYKALVSKIDHQEAWKKDLNDLHGNIREVTHTLSDYQRINDARLSNAEKRSDYIADYATRTNRICQESDILIQRLQTQVKHLFITHIILVVSWITAIILLAFLG